MKKGTEYAQTLLITKYLANFSHTSAKKKKINIIPTTLYYNKYMILCTLNDVLVGLKIFH